MISLGEAFPKEQARVRAVLATYYALGPAGAIGAMLIEQVLQRADEAAIVGDIAELLASFKELQGVS